MFKAVLKLKHKLSKKFCQQLKKKNNNNNKQTNKQKHSSVSWRILSNNYFGMTLTVLLHCPLRAC